MLADIGTLTLWVCAYAAAWYVVSLLYKRNDVADVAWGLGYVLIAAYLALRHSPSGTALWVYAFTSIWALRLSGHIFLRNRGKGEDFRYRQWREEWGSAFYVRSFLQVYLLQGFFMLVIAAPLIVAGLSGPAPQGFWPGFALGAGSVLWAVGFYFETVADHQLARFLKTRRHKEEVLQTGLWRYSRHPNYFGEILVWWGLFLIVLPLPYGWPAVVSPLTITFLLAFVSGVPMLERRYEGNAEYQAYKRRTRALVPGRKGRS